MDEESTNEISFKCIFIKSYEVSNDTVMNRLQIDTYGRYFDLESGLRMRRECWERFPRHRRLAIPTCITACVWRMYRDACRNR